MMDSELTSTQRQLLEAVRDAFESEDDPVTAEELGAQLGRSPGAVRNTMQILRSLQLVEGVPGPEGGYVLGPATEPRAEEIAAASEEGPVPIAVGGQPLQNTAAADLAFPDVDDAERCRAEIGLDGRLPLLDQGESVKVGPVPTTGIVLEGRVLSLEEREQTLVCDVDTVAIEE